MLDPPSVWFLGGPGPLQAWEFPGALQEGQARSLVAVVPVRSFAFVAVRWFSLLEFDPVWGIAQTVVHPESQGLESGVLAAQVVRFVVRLRLIRAGRLALAFFLVLSGGYGLQWADPGVDQAWCCPAVLQGELGVDGVLYGSREV
jgi:hypothetical protein